MPAGASDSPSPRQLLGKLVPYNSSCENSATDSRHNQDLAAVINAKPAPLMNNEGDIGLEKVQQMQLTWAQCFKDAVHVWREMLSNTLYKLTAILILVWMYYIPARILTASILNSVEPILYEKIRNVSLLSSFWHSMSTCFIETFGFDYSQKAILFSFLPMWLLGIISGIVFSGEVALHNLNADFSTATGFALGLLLVARSMKITTKSKDGDDCYNLTKDGTPAALLKGVIGIFVVVIFPLQFLFPLYLESTFYVQLFFRFLVFPFCFSVSKWYQMHVVFGLTKHSMERRIIIIKMCHHFIYFYERLYLSNLSTSGSSSAEYIIAILASSSFEFIMALLFRQRIRIMHGFSEKIHILFKCFTWRRNSNHVVSIVPEERGGIILEECKVNKVDYMERSLDFHSMQLCDDMMGEILSIFTAPLLMYFLYPIFPDTEFHAIPSLGECVSQISIQLLFEVVFDILSLTYQLKSGIIEKDIVSRWGVLKGNKIILFVIFCILHMHFLLRFYSTEVF